MWVKKLGKMMTEHSGQADPAVTSRSTLDEQKSQLLTHEDVLRTLVEQQHQITLNMEHIAAMLNNLQANPSATLPSTAPPSALDPPMPSPPTFCDVTPPTPELFSGEVGVSSGGSVSSSHNPSYRSTGGHHFWKSP
ncbi:hypothetical protein ILYODFUR_012180 [Ilyodon furcidens]|uniref:Uncharacterized protein n=1 Tax=Ilyodon furcidens TaxID=33524 RepID=A0ABV0UR88_9TELE